MKKLTFILVLAALILGSASCSESEDIDSIELINENGGIDPDTEPG